MTVLIDSNAITDPAVNQALEEYCLTGVAPHESCVILYVNDPVVVVGKHQCVFAEVDLRAAQREGIGVIRRISGGGSVYHDGGTLSNCVIRHCTSGWQGGGLYINDGGSIVGCSFEYNSAQQGGGAYLYYNGIMRDCTFVGNHAAVSSDFSGDVEIDATTEPRGGGVYLANGGLVEDCLLRGNHAVSGSGAMIHSRGTVRRCIVSENISVYYSALYCRFGGTVDACYVSLNSALSAAGVMCDNGGVVRNSVIARNSAQQNAGAQIVNPGRMENCTVASNVASAQVGGVYASGHAPILNSIVYANTAPSYNNVHGNADGRYCCTYPELNGEGNITNDPLLAYLGTGFCDLRPGSPCIGAGSNLPWSASATDISGRPRVLGGVVDIGAYEATNGPIIWADPVILNFGDVMPGEIRPGQVLMGNAGNMSLSGAVSGVQSPFGVSGGGSYALALDGTAVIAVVFAPSALGGYTNDIILTGGDGAPVSLRGTAVPEPAALLALAVAIAAFVRFRGSGLRCNR